LVGWLLRCLEFIGRKISLRNDARTPGCAGVVGYFLDRNEGDHFGNIDEFERIFSLLGVQLVSTWLSSSDIAKLSKIDEAEVIYFFKGFRSVATKIASRTGAKIVEISMPIGLSASADFMRSIATFSLNQANIDALVLRESSRYFEIYNRLVRDIFLGKTFGYVGDPFLASGLFPFLSQAGAFIGDCCLLAREEQCKEIIDSKMVSGRLYFEPKRGEIDFSKHDYIITNSYGREFCLGKGVVIEIGFPSFSRHCFCNTPYVGYAGLLPFLELFYNSVSEYNSYE
jgi:nitrogenase molybdenum-iron protein alpha/beta subunit